MVRELNRRLSITDASFLYVEKPNQPMHVGSCLIYEGQLSADELIRALRERMHLLPRYRQKVVFPPFGIDHPTWEDDPNFDVVNHVGESTLPAPGDDRVLSEVGGQRYAPMLDRDRPLWQVHLFHGRPDGNTAVVWKIHHAMVDGVSMIDLMLTLHDLQPDAPPPEPPPAPWQPRPLPDPLTLAQDAMRDRLADAARRWTEASFRWLRPPAAEPQRPAAPLAGPPQQPAGPMPFNGQLSERRQFAWAEFSFTEIRQIRSALGGTVNDVVLAVVAGALGRYLRAHGVRTEGLVLWAICPVSLRRADERGALGNRVSVMIVPLYVGIGDPAARLAAERETVERLKREDQAGTLAQMAEMGNAIPPAWQALSAQYAPPPNPAFTPIHTASSNVPGPQIPLYLAGHKLLRWCGLAPLGGTMGLFNGIVSYNGTLAISATVDPLLVPDVWFYTDCLHEAFAELRAAARAAVPAA